MGAIKSGSTALPCFPRSIRPDHRVPLLATTSAPSLRCARTSLRGRSLCPQFPAFPPLLLSLVAAPRSAPRALARGRASPTGQPAPRAHPPDASSLCLRRFHASRDAPGRSFPTGSTLRFRRPLASFAVRPLHHLLRHVTPLLRGAGPNPWRRRRRRRPTRHPDERQASDRSAEPNPRVSARAERVWRGDGGDFLRTLCARARARARRAESFASSAGGRGEPRRGASAPAAAAATAATAAAPRVESSSVRVPPDLRSSRRASPRPPPSGDLPGAPPRRRRGHFGRGSRIRRYPRCPRCPRRPSARASHRRPTGSPTTRQCEPP